MPSGSSFTAHFQTMDTGTHHGAVWRFRLAAQTGMSTFGRDWQTLIHSRKMWLTRPNHALQRTRRERRGCNRVPCAGSLSLSR